MRQTVAEYIVRFCEQAGIRHAFGVIGSGILQVMDALPRVSNIQYVSTQHEQGAAFMADGYARLTGRPALCFATVGSGATNLVGGIAQAFTESSPMIVLIGEKSTDISGRGPSNFHEIDQRSLFAPITKKVLYLHRADRIGEVMSDAFRTACSGRMGPVVVILPSDLQKVVIDLELPTRPIVPTGRPAGDEDLVKHAAQILLNSQRPVFLLGGGAGSSGAVPDALALAEVLPAPVVVTQMQKGIVPEDHPLSAGAAGSLGGSLGASVLGQADCIFVVGSTLSEVTTAKYSNSVIPDQAKLIQIDIDAGEIGKVFPVDVGIVGDARAVVQQFRQLLSGLEPSESSKELHRLRSTWLEQVQRRVADHWNEAETESERPILSRWHLLTTVRRLIGKESIIVAESGATHMWANHAFKAYNRMLCPGDYSVMGSGYGIALGAKVAYPERTVVSFTGDGASMMILPELATAVRYGLNVVMVVPRNNVYGSVVWQQQSQYGGHLVATELAVPDLADVAHSFGAYGETVTKFNELESAFERALASNCPSVLDVHLEPDGQIIPPGMLRYQVSPSASDKIV